MIRPIWRWKQTYGTFQRNTGSNLSVKIKFSPKFDPYFVLPYSIGLYFSNANLTIARLSSCKVGRFDQFCAVNFFLLSIIRFKEFKLLSTII